MDETALLTPEQFASLKTAALLIFFAAFMLILGWLAISRSGKFEEASRIPLNDDSPGTTTRGSKHE